MASWGSDSGSEDDFIRPPRSPRLMIPHPPEQLHPDTEQNVAEQTEDIFKNFFYQRYRQEQIRQPYDATPRVPELLEFGEAPLSPTAEIGRQLARIGDDINDRYSDVFTEMMRNLNINENTAYEAFANVARKLIENGINWGRVLTLLCFGYRIAVSILKSGTAKFAAFMKKIVGYFVTFIMKEKIAKWIADHGGWGAALSFVPSMSTGKFIALLSLAFLSVAAVIYKKYA
ncbi:bcl-2 homologous antagonist/killer-like [Gigantopelta aegis]|uniref:bcl-2 homologous antagonist/killer-like n=1 Tax=Gigantopelta aegis TaxID=1735272 RepID=UPI001B88D518|nr:bcl-2 homologous antagonist/killer-like [Gigantopelta aegis]